ncbi:MAG: hypothetical protein AAF549_05435 [Pseudomonadota bacterium]
MIKVECRETFYNLTQLQQTKAQNPLFVISSIVMVGALLNENEGIDEMDRDLLFASLSEFIRLGAGLDLKNLDLKIYNYDYSHDNGDFLKHKPHADMVLFCKVNKKGILGPVPNWKESPLNNHAKAWQQAISESNPALISLTGDPLTCVNDDDIPTSYRQLRGRFKKGPAAYQHFVQRNSAAYQMVYG